MDSQDLRLLAGRKMLLEVPEIDMEPVAWIHRNRDAIDRLLTENGALLIRGLPIGDEREFQTALEALFGEALLDYVYRSTPRTRISASRVYTASEYHPSETILQHNENAYANSWPLRIGFLCLVVAQKMGNTPLSDSRSVYQEIPAGIRDEFEQKKIMYVRNYSDIDLPWTEVFQTTSKQEVEDYCRRNRLQYEWLEGGLRTKQINQACIDHPITGERLWFNQAHLFHVSNLSAEVRESLIELVGEENLPRNTYFGDGTPIGDDELAVIRKIYEKQKFSFQWEQHDLLLLDNMLFAHGREPFEGPRKVLVGMGRTYCPTAIPVNS